MITCIPNGTFTIDKYNYYSDRYVLEGFTWEDVTMQYEDVTYQVIPEKTALTKLYKKGMIMCD